MSYRPKSKTSVDMEAQSYTPPPKTSVDFELADINDYSKEELVSLPTGDSWLANIYNASQRTDVNSSDDVRVTQTAKSGNYVVHQFRFQNSNNTDLVDISIELQTDHPPSTNPVVLEVYNNNTGSWEQLGSNSSTGTGTDFTLSGSKNSSDYYNSDNVVACRVYQYKA